MSGTGDISASATVRTSERIAARVIDGKAVVIVIDTQQLHTLNSVGTFVFEQLDEAPRKISELVGATVAEFEVDRESAERDVSQFVSQLQELGALVVEEPT